MVLVPAVVYEYRDRHWYRYRYILYQVHTV